MRSGDNVKYEDLRSARQASDAPGVVALRVSIYGLSINALLTTRLFTGLGPSPVLTRPIYLRRPLPQAAPRSDGPSRAVACLRSPSRTRRGLVGVERSGGADVGVETRWQAEPPRPEPPGRRAGAGVGRTWPRVPGSGAIPKPWVPLASAVTADAQARDGSRRAGDAPDVGGGPARASWRGEGQGRGAGAG